MTDDFDRVFRRSGVVGAQSARRVASWRDVALNRFNLTLSSSEAPTKINGPVHGIGLTGQLPPGAALVCAPDSAFNALIAFGAALGGDDHQAVFRTHLESAGNARVIAMPPELFILRAGDVVTFAEALEALWVYPLAWGQGGGDSDGRGYTHDARAYAYNVIPRAVARVFHAPGSAPSSLAWAPVPYVSRVENVNAADPDGSENTGYYVRCLGASHVTVCFSDNQSSLQRIQGAETGDYEVWWWLGDGLYHHNPADDFDGAGRGSADATHDVEVYEVPRNAIAVFVKKSSGNDFWHTVIATDMGSPR